MNAWQSPAVARQALPKCVTMPNFMVIVKPLLTYGDFSILKMAAVRHLGFIKGRNFNGRQGGKGQFASPCQISRRSVEPLLRYYDFSIFPRWRLSPILVWLCLCLDHPRRAFGGLYHCPKFGWNRCSSFHNRHVLVSRVWLQNTDSCPKIVFMVALWNRADHYIFMLWFVLSSSSFFLFFPRLISDWMSAVLPHMVWPQCEFKMQV